MKLSVIIPVYNASNTLDKLFSGLLQQGLPAAEYELIVIDDGSTDDSYDLCCKWASENEQIKVFKQPNSGPSKARNLGISKASGDKVLFCDADDYLEPDSFCTLLDRPSKDLILFGLFDDTYAEGKLINSVSWKPEHRLYSTTTSFLQDFHYVLDQSLLYSQCTKLYDRKILDTHQIRFREDLKMGEDVLFNLSYFQYASNVEIIDRSLYHYLHLVHSTSISNSYYDGYFQNVCYVLSQKKALLQRFDALDAANILSISNFFMGRCSSAIQNELWDKSASFSNKYKRVKAIICSPQAQEAALAAKPQNRFHKFVASCIKHRSVFITMVAFSLLQVSKKYLPALISKLKK